MEEKTMERENAKLNTKVKRNQTAKVGEKYSYKYVDIAQIHEYLEENNMRYYQYIDRIDGDDYIMTVKIIDGKELPAIRGARVVDATLIGVNNPAQQQGSALTYARRYSLLMAFGLATEDDDAQSLSTDKVVYATEKQLDLIKKIYQDNKLELKEIMEGLNKTKIEELTLKEASDIIAKAKE